MFSAAKKMTLRLQLQSAPTTASFSPRRQDPSFNTTTSVHIRPRTTTTSDFLSGITPRLILRTPTPIPSLTSDSGLLFRKKLLYLENHLGISSSLALDQNPDLRSFPLSSLISITSFLRHHFAISHPRDAGRILSMNPSLLTCNPQSDLLPIAEFLVHTVGISSPKEIRKAVIRCPRILISSVENQLLPALYFLRRIGFVGAHKINCQTTLLLVSSVETTLIPKLDYIQSLGFSYKEAIKMVLRSPGLFTLSIENNFRPKVEFLVGEMGRDVKEVRDFPQYFSFSLEKKIKLRHRLLVEHGFSMPLREMLKVSDGEFNDRLVEMRLLSVEGRR